MQFGEGTKVKTVANFTDRGGLTFPERGEILTVAHSEPHHNSHCRKAGIVLLTFKDRPDIHPLCDKQINDKPNFIPIKNADTGKVSKIKRRRNFSNRSVKAKANVLHG